MTGERTSIQLYVSTKKRLDEIGSKNDSYDDIIRRLLDQLERKKGIDMKQT